MHLLTGQLRQGVTHNCDRQAVQVAVRWWREKRDWTELLAPLNASSATALRALSGCKTLAIWRAGCAAGVSGPVHRSATCKHRACL